MRCPVVLLLAVVCRAALAAPMPAAPPPLWVSSVVDGDTLKISSGDTVRLIGVDTPESKQPGQPLQFWALQAAEFTRAAAKGKLVTLEYDRTLRDKYGRLLAYVYLPGHVLLNAEIVRLGHGRAYLDYPFQYSAWFASLEAQARAARAGMWAWPDRVFRADPLPTMIPDPGAPAPKPSPPSGKPRALPRAPLPTDVVWVVPHGRCYHGPACTYGAGDGRRQLTRAQSVASGYMPCRWCQPKLQP